MRVLITNTRLDGRGGTETFVRQLARGLEARGHTAMAYSSDPAELPRLLESDVVPVATDLARLPLRPDIIHAQHHLDTMAALLSLPGVPAVYHCHGAVWRESVPAHPRIYEHLAVSHTLADRLSVEFAIPPDRISVLPNGVDLARFQPRSPLPARPARALVYHSRHDADSAAVRAIAEATSARGIAMDTVGARFGRLTDRPEVLLPAYDVVFASGLSALEALACGCAVIVLGRTSCGDLVGDTNFDRYRRTNFSVAVNSEPPSAAAIGAALDRYDAAECARVSARTRAEAGFDRLLDRLVPIYERIVERHRSAEGDPVAELSAAAQYLRRIVPLVKMTDRLLDGQWSSPTRATTFEELRAEVELLRRRVETTP